MQSAKQWNELSESVHFQPRFMDGKSLYALGYAIHYSEHAAHL